MAGVLEVLSAQFRKRMRKRAQPDWLPPMLATLTEKTFSSADWIYERKYDGVRCLAFRHGDEIRLLSRAQKSMNNMFPELIESLTKQTSHEFIIDGEIVAFEGTHTRFGKLQGRLGIVNPRRSRSRANDIPIFFYVFDVLHVEGHDATALPLLERKMLLQRLIDFRASGVLRFSEHRARDGEKFLQDACHDGWEGLIAKRADSPYVHGRSRDWLKFKCINEQEFVVLGFTDPQGSRIGFGSLLVGYYDQRGELHFAGKVGTGYDDETLRLLTQHMKRIEINRPPITQRDSSLRNAHWIKPNLVAQVGFTEWTGEGRLRHPRFLGLRTDKPASKVVRELPLR